MELVKILGPGLPALGMRSAQDPSTLPQGVYSRLENVRCVGGTLKVRDGAVQIVSSSVDPDAELKGLYSATLNGTAYLFGAFRFGGATRLYYLSGSSWVEIVGVGSILSSDGDVGFAVVHQEGIDGVNTSGDVLIIGNGNKVATVSTESTLFDTVGEVVELTTPTTVTQTAIPYGYQLIAPDTQVDTSRAYNSDDAKMKMTPGISTTGADLNVKTSVTDGTTATIVFDVSVLYDGTFPQGLTLQKELCFAAYWGGSGDSLWDYMSKVEALVRPTSTSTIAITGTSAAGGAITVTSSANHGYSTGDFVYVSGVSGFAISNGVFRITVTGATTFTLDGSNTGGGSGTGTGGTARRLEWITLWDSSSIDTSFYQFDIEQKAGVTLQATPKMAVIPCYPYEGREGWCGLRFTANGEQPSVDTHAQLMVAATSGQIDGRSLFAVSYSKPSGFSEGVAKLAERGSASLMSLGGTLLGYRYFWEPNSDWRTAFRISFPGSDDLSGTPTKALVYRSDPYLADDGTPLFGPFNLDTAFTLPTSEPANGNLAYSTSADVDASRIARDAGSTNVPSGSLFAVSNDRLFVAGIGSGSSLSELWISEDKNPFHFRRVPLTDDDGNQLPTSPTYRTFPGHKVMWLLPLQGDIFGVDTLLLWTDRAVFRLGGFDSRSITQAGRLSELGTLRGQTVAAFGSQVWYLDTQRQARRLNGALSGDAVSENRVDDFLFAGTLTGACALTGYESFRLFFQEAGAPTIRVALVWEKDTQEWVLDRFPFDIGGVVAHEDGAQRLMLACEPGGKLWELERFGQTTENGSAIPIRIDWREWSQGWEPFTFGSFGVICDGAVDATLRTTRTSPYDGSTATGAIDLTNANLTTASAWRWDDDGSDGIPGTPVGFSCIPKLDTPGGGLPGGKRIRAWVMQVEPRATGADRG